METPLSATMKQRTRIPKVMDTNPFCQERQLTDAYELMRLNANPRISTQTTAQVYKQQLSQNDTMMKSVTDLRERSSLGLNPKKVKHEECRDRLMPASVVK